MKISKSSANSLHRCHSISHRLSLLSIKSASAMSLSSNLSPAQNYTALVTHWDTCECEQLAQSHYVTVEWPGIQDLLSLAIHHHATRPALTYSAMHEQEGMIQLFAAAKCPLLDILLHQIAESYLLVHASLSKLTQSSLFERSTKVKQSRTHPKNPDKAVRGSTLSWFDC